MSWIQKLHETYQRCHTANALQMVSHATQQAHIEITIDDTGHFKEATIIEKENTIIPATEQSAGRTSTAAPHPLCDKLHYCAADYPHYGGLKPSYFTLYEQLLTEWCESEFSHIKAKAILTYIRQGQVVADLVKAQILWVENGHLLTNWNRKDPPARIFQLLTAKKEKDGTVIKPSFRT